MNQDLSVENSFPRVIFIIPYFGRFPTIFPFWLASCRHNPKFHWLLITDDQSNLAYPENVKVQYQTFEEFRARVQEKFDFPISLSKPYKICDFRPAFGKIFESEICGYDLWGFCDIDLIWGDLKIFFTLDRLKNFDKLLSHGHCCLLKNTPEINVLFQQKISGALNYQDVYSTDTGMVFDENGLKDIGKGFVDIAEKTGLRIWNCPHGFADILVGSYSLVKLYIPKPRRKHSIFIIDNGTVVQAYLDSSTGKLCREEQMYVHLQKRPPEIQTQNNDRFMIIPPGIFVDYQEDWKTQINNLASEGWPKWRYDLKVMLKLFPLRARFTMLRMIKFLFGKTLYNKLKKLKNQEI